MSDPTLFDSLLKPQQSARRVENVRPNQYLGQSFSKAPILAQLDSPESVEAGIENMKRRGSQEQRVLDLLQAEGPMTDSQIADALGLAENSARPRRVSLVEKGEVERVGTATTKTGRAAALWGVR